MKTTRKFENFFTAAMQERQTTQLRITVRIDRGKVVDSRIETNEAIHIE